MKSKYLLSLLVCTLVGAVGIPVIAAGRSGQAGKSKVAHLYLYEKDPASWQIVDGGAWGKMKHNLSGSTFDYVFNGHWLVAGQDYTLIYYPDPWPGQNLICLGQARADEEGNVHIEESVDTGSLPAETDENYPDGAKIWLVLSDDVNCNSRQMVGWNATEYLFEYQLITFEDTDDAVM
jgi:hypothetical protein